MSSIEYFDVIVLGLGANGSSALYQLSKSDGQPYKVAGIDSFHPPHPFGSSHGESRIIRQAYYEDPVYVPLVKAAYPLWESLEQEAGIPLFLKTGGLMLGSPEAAVIKGARLSAETHGIPYEYLETGELERRFPAFRPDPDTVGVLEKQAGILFPEKCISAFLRQAAIHGADIRLNEKLLKIVPGPEGTELHTSKGHYFTKKLVVSAGAWLPELFPDLQLPLTIERQVLYWFKNKNQEKQPPFQPGVMPVYIWEYEPGRMFYGFPDLGTGLKIAHHHKGRNILPGQLTQDVSPDEIRDMQEIVEKYLDIDPVFDASAVCMYTNTPDENFIIDYHPNHKNIILASPCSGHGFKFSSLTGKLLSEMALDQPTDFDLTPFALGRPSIQPAGSLHPLTNTNPTR